MKFELGNFQSLRNLLKMINIKIFSKKSKKMFLLVSENIAKRKNSKQYFWYLRVNYWAFELNK